MLDRSIPTREALVHSIPISEVKDMKSDVLQALKGSPFEKKLWTLFAGSILTVFKRKKNCIAFLRGLSTCPPLWSRPHKLEGICKVKLWCCKFLWYFQEICAGHAVRIRVAQTTSIQSAWTFPDIIVQGWLLWHITCLWVHYTSMQPALKLRNIVLISKWENKLLLVRLGGTVESAILA
jgi:hypothetical protein